MAKIVLMSLNLTDISFRICLVCWNHSYFAVSLHLKMREQAAPQQLECTLLHSVCTVLANESGERDDILRESTRKRLRVPAPECAKAGRGVRKTREVSERKTAANRK